MLTSCNRKEVLYSGFNDLVVGIQSIHLYTDQEFRLELGAGGARGTYSIANDTVYLDYLHKPERWPDKVIMTKEYFETIADELHKMPVRINRNK